MSRVRLTCAERHERQLWSANKMSFLYRPSQRAAAILVTLTLICITSSAASAATTDHPNIVLILADDMGWGDAQCYNPNSKIPTPHIDRLAAEGIRFTDAHSPSAVCTPTRYGLLTGRYCWRTRLKSSVLDGFSPPLIEPDRPTLASYLKQQGYSTACVGKWHLGMQWTRSDGTMESEDRGSGGFRGGENIDFAKPLTSGPLTVGFDHFFGISASLDMPPYAWIVQDRCDPPPTTAATTNRDGLFMNQTAGAADPAFKLDQVLPRLKEHATNWIKRQHLEHPEQPFFLYLPLTSPHLPVAPSESFRGTSGAGLYGDFVVETDDCVGAVLETLSSIGVDENTLVVFTSDNGGLWHQWEPVEADDRAHYRSTPRARYTADFGHHSNAHLRGTKADIWEGGHRVPMVVRWPGKVNPGMVCDQLVQLTDWMATVAEVIGQPLPDQTAEDSVSLLPLLMGRDKPIRETAIHHSLRGSFAIRSGHWKLVESRGSGGFSQPRQVQPKATEPQGQLYHLSSDPSETKNVWKQQPRVVDDLKIRLGDIVHPRDRQRVMIRSTADESSQPSILILPSSPNLDPASNKVPMVVNLHSWSADLTQRTVLEWLVTEKGWVFLAPNFRGANSQPQACGSKLAQQDILDAVQWAIDHHNVDPQRVYLTGASGGGHMTMLMAARYPDVWRAASAWVGISDLVAWHEKHRGSRYGNMMEACCGGAPGDSNEVDRQYAQRSPLTYMSDAHKVAIDIAAGIHDGHTGSVPILHSIVAFNRIADANQTEAVSDEEIRALSLPSGRLAAPKPGDEGFDPSFGRQHYLRRHSGNARLTIFEGGHEGIATATMAWFDRHR